MTLLAPLVYGVLLMVAAYAGWAARGQVLAAELRAEGEKDKRQDADFAEAREDADAWEETAGRALGDLRPVQPVDDPRDGLLLDDPVAAHRRGEAHAPGAAAPDDAPPARRVDP